MPASAVAVLGLGGQAAAGLAGELVGDLTLPPVGEIEARGDRPAELGRGHAPHGPLVHGRALGARVAYAVAVGLPALQDVDSTRRVAVGYRQTHLEVLDEPLDFGLHRDGGRVCCEPRRASERSGGAFELDVDGVLGARVAGFDDRLGPPPGQPFGVFGEILEPEAGLLDTGGELVAQHVEQPGVHRSGQAGLGLAEVVERVVQPVGRGHGRIERELCELEEAALPGRLASEVGGSLRS